MNTKRAYNYFNLQICLTEANKTLRNMFKNRWKEVFYNKWNDTETDALFFTTDERGRDIKKQLRGKQFQISLESGNSKEWDINLLATILLSKLFQEKSSKIHIERIREIRNKLAHLPDMTVNDEVFEDLYEAFCQSMKSLGFGENSFSLLKSKFYNQQSKTCFDEDLEFKRLTESANNEFTKKSYKEALKLHSTIINSYEHSNEEYGGLYYKRSLTNLHIYDESVDKDEKYLYKSLSDAEKAIDYRPNIAEGYIQAADVAFKLNELEQSEEFYKKALTIECDNNEIKNSLAFVRSKIGQQKRMEHLDLKYLPFTTEETNESLVKTMKENRGVNLENCDFEKAKKLIEKIDPTKVDVFLGHEYRDGSKNFKKNYEMAAKCYGKAANKKNAEALYNLALLHMKGLGVRMDYQIAIGLLKQAASQPENIMIGYNKIPNIGVSEAEHSLGLAYEQGTYVEKDLHTAINWYERAVKHGNSNSANNLALLYQGGEGVEQSFDKAEELFLLSHKLGNTDAITNLVGFYLLKSDPDQALVWHKRALKITV